MCCKLTLWLGRYTRCPSSYSRHILSQLRPLPWTTIRLPQYNCLTRHRLTNLLEIWELGWLLCSHVKCLVFSVVGCHSLCFLTLMLNTVIKLWEQSHVLLQLLRMYIASSSPSANSTFRILVVAHDCLDLVEKASALARTSRIITKLSNLLFSRSIIGLRQSWNLQIAADVNYLRWGGSAEHHLVCGAGRGVVIKHILPCIISSKCLYLLGLVGG